MVKPSARPVRRTSPPDAESPGNPAVANWGLRLIGIGLIGLLLPTVGLTFRKLEAIGDAQWIVLACLVAAGSAAFFWGHRHRPAFAGAVVGGALALVPLLAYVSFWRHAKEPPPVAQTSVPPRRNQVAPQPRVTLPPPEALHGRIHRLGVEISGKFNPEELALISEFVLDCEPDAESVQTYLTRKPDQEESTFFPTVWLGPVDRAEEFLAQLKFGTVSIIAAQRIRIEVHRPLGPAADSVRNRVAAALEALRSRELSRLPATFKMLVTLAPLARREEVAAELLGLLATPKPANTTPRLGESPAAALKRWALPEQTEAIRQLVGQDGINQADVFDVLGTVLLRSPYRSRAI